MVDSQAGTTTDGDGPLDLVQHRWGEIPGLEAVIALGVLGHLADEPGLGARLEVLSAPRHHIAAGDGVAHGDYLSTSSPAGGPATGIRNQNVVISPSARTPIMPPWATTKARQT